MTDLVQKLVGALEHCEGVFMSHSIDHINGGKIEDDALAIIRAALSEAKAGGWVSVDDRLPEQYVEVLVAFDGITLPSTGQYTGNARDVNGWSYPSENFGSTDKGTDPIVTHWQPLPAPPAQREEA